MSFFLLAALAASPLGSIELSIQETGGAPLKLGRAIEDALGETGWRVVPHRPEGERCLITGTVSTGAMGKDVFARYAFRVTTETGATLASVDGQVDRVTPANARDQAVNALRSALTSALAAHPMADSLVIRGLEEDWQVRQLRGALASLPRVAAVDEGHLSNGVVTFAVTSRLAASALAPALGEISVGGKRLRIEYAGVDLLTAALN